MRESGGGSVAQSWLALLEGGPVAGLEDGPLLERFARRGLEGSEAAETAFAALVARHGPMVRRVCRGLLADPHDADDAFQATFLVLARKARSIRQPERLAGWLHGTAHRASKRLRADLARRRRHEAAHARADHAPSPESESDPGRSEEAAVVLEEVAALPGECRVAVVLCDLEGLTQEEAARRLGCSDRTLRRRLAHAHDLLRSRLTRRGLAPPATVLAIGSNAVPLSLIEASARLAPKFASGQGAAGMVPASARALTLARGVIEAMNWTGRLKTGVAIAGCVVALGGGIGVASGLRTRPQEAGKAQATPKTRTAEAKPDAVERYKALVKRWDDAMKFYQEEASKAKTPDEVGPIFLKFGPFAKDYSPAFVALAEEFPADPVALDALMWVARQGLSSVYQPDDPGGRAFARSLEILARDHADKPEVVLYAEGLAFLLLDPIREDFLRAVAGRSQDRAARGRSTLALAEYLGQKAALVGLLQRPDLPADLDALTPPNTPDEERRKMEADPAAYRLQVEAFYSKYMPASFEAMRRVDLAALRGEVDRAQAQILADFADIPAVSDRGKPTRETLGELDRRRRGPRPPIPAESRVQPLAAAYKAAEKKAQDASNAAGQGEAGVKAYIAAAPKWADYGPRMWAIAEAAPRSPDGFAALLWITGHTVPFFDSGEERAATLGQAVDALIADHLDDLGDHLDDREVAAGMNHGSPIPAPHVDRLFRALFERGKTRAIRGRMGLVLARFSKAEADLAESFEVRGADPAARPEVAIFPESYLAHIRQAGPHPFVEESATILEKLKADYADVADANGVGPTGETLAIVVDRELADLRTRAVGQLAPEIVGQDVEGRPMALSEFRGKVVVLDFGTHEHCGGCKLVYPRQRELVDQFQSRPFAMLGINFGDHLGVLDDLRAKKEVTWRCWWDGDDFARPGPITTRWNIKGYPTFVVLDHKGVIRFKDLHPFDPTFGPAVEKLVREAEADRR